MQMENWMHLLREKERRRDVYIVEEEWRRRVNALKDGQDGKYFTKREKERREKESGKEK